MSAVDWLVLLLTLFIIVLYGVYKSRGNRTTEDYLMGDHSLKWYHVCLSVMATQASAITFLSAPGLGYTNGLGFVQFYFGLPLAMVVLSITFIPIFHKLNVYTAYEFLENRFDLKTRSLTAGLFLIQRGLSTGITIYAPSIILSTILDINTTYTTLFIGTLVIGYTVYGGTKAVTYTQTLQMLIIFLGLFVAGIMIIQLLPSNIGFIKAIQVAGKMGKTNAIDLSFDLKNEYTLWSGLIAGFFLQLSYFGTDQSQVGRYLTGSSVAQSRMGLLMNGLVKIPMQFFILLIGVLLFTFYQFKEPPIFFNKYELGKLDKSEYHEELKQLKSEYSLIYQQKAAMVNKLSEAININDQKLIDQSSELLRESDEKSKAIKSQLTALMEKNDPKANIKDNNYIFLSFVTEYLPKGIIGLLVAIIFLASMGSTSSALNSLASTSVIDIYKRMIRKNETEQHYMNVSRIVTIFWGAVCMAMGLYAAKLGNLLEAVNILGSLFYGTILGIFIIAFYFKKPSGTTVCVAALITEVIVFSIWQADIMAFLWLNVVGCWLLIIVTMLLTKLKKFSFLL